MCRIRHCQGFRGGSDGKESHCNAGDLGSVPGLGRSPGGGHCNPLPYSCLENPHGRRNLEGCSPLGRKELDMTERLSPQTLSWHFLSPTSQVMETLGKLLEQSAFVFYVCVLLGTACTTGKQASSPDRLSGGAHCKVRELEKARFRGRTRPILYRIRSPLMRQEGAAVRPSSCSAKSRRE